MATLTREANEPTAVAENPEVKHELGQTPADTTTALPDKGPAAALEQRVNQPMVSYDGVLVPANVKTALEQMAQDSKNGVAKTMDAYGLSVSKNPEDADYAKQAMDQHPEKYQVMSQKTEGPDGVGSTGVTVDRSPVTPRPESVTPLPSAGSIADSDKKDRPGLFGRLGNFLRGKKAVGIGAGLGATIAATSLIPRDSVDKPVVPTEDTNPSARQVMNEGLPSENALNQFTGEQPKTEAEAAPKFPEQQPEAEAQPVKKTITIEAGGSLWAALNRLDPGNAQNAPERWKQIAAIVKQNEALYNQREPGMVERLNAIGDDPQAIASYFNENNRAGRLLNHAGDQITYDGVLPQ